MLFVFQEGIGNVAEAIPLYLALREKFEVEVVYLKQYPTDNMEKASFVPCDDITECTLYEIDDLIAQYEWCVEASIRYSF